MKGSDYIVSFLEKNSITDIFGYPGATVCHLMDSLEKSRSIRNHLNYHEQACAFAACGYAQSSGKIGVAYANGGPGFTNLISGIANAFYDSIPTIFICGQVDVSDMVGNRLIRQSGIQEIPISKIASNFVKEAIFVDKPEKLVESMHRAFGIVQNGRPGPVLLEIPANIQRADIEVSIIEECNEKRRGANKDFEIVFSEINNSKRPCLLVGNGIKISGLVDEFRKCVEKLAIPVVFTLPAFDLLSFDSKYNYGFIGNNGCRYSNYILNKCDLIVSMGARLDVKVVGKDKNTFVHDAKLIRIDVDSNELSERITENEIQIHANVKEFFDEILSRNSIAENTAWLHVCEKIKTELYRYDFKNYHFLLQNLFQKADFNACFTADVGHHEIYMAQSLQLKEKQNVIFSLGLASMGYSLPAAIGAYYAKGAQVISVSGDGGIQMNLQELQFISRENIPIKIIVFNNNSLGMVREFQERNFNNICCKTTDAYGYSVPEFEKIAFAYGLKYTKIQDTSEEDIKNFEFEDNIPEFIEIIISEPTYLYPRYARNKRICDMEPELDNLKREMIDKL